MITRLINIYFNNNYNYDLKDLWKNNLDKKEYDRQLSEHCSILTYLNENFISPIKNNLKKGITVIDIGCGCGLWVIDNANNFKNSVFIGIDIVNYFPNDKQKIPQNVNFYIYDFLKDDIHKIFGNNSVEFIYQRHMIVSYKFNDWDIAIKKIYNLLKTNAYVEFVEFDIKNSKVGPLTKEINDCVIEILKENDYDVDISVNLKYKLINNGFNNNNIFIRHEYIPLNDCYLKEDFILGYIRLKEIIMTKLKIRENKFNNILNKIKKEWDKENSYIKLLVISAKK